MAKNQKFEIGQRVTAEDGSWVELQVFQHGSNFYHVYGFKFWSPGFSSELPYAESATHMSRAKIERQMRNHLAGK